MSSRRFQTISAILLLTTAIHGGSSSSSLCEEHYQLFLSSRGSELWAAKMADSFGSFPYDGKTEGNRFARGAFYSCLEVDPKDGEYGESTSVTAFRGQHCLATALQLPTAAIAGGEEEGRIERIVEDFKLSSSRNIRENRGYLVPLLPPYSDAFSGPKAQSLISGSQFGLCVPSSCSPEEVRSLILNEASSSLSNPLTTVAFVLQDDCVAEEDAPDLTGGDIAYISLLAVFVLLILAGTLLDLKNRRWPPPPPNEEGAKPGMGQQLLLGFSCYTNTSKLLDTSNRRPDQIPCLDGIRFWSMTWVVLLHTYDYGTTQMRWAVMNVNEVFSEDFLGGFLFRAVYNAIPCVDSFFLIGGCLLGYLTFKEMDRNGGKINLVLFYLHRYIRITGVYAFVVGFFASIYKFFDFGELNNVQNESVGPCSEDWWRNLLYINNFYWKDMGDACLGQTWYLAAEMQMFVFTPLALIPMWHLHKKWGRKASLAYLSVFLVGAWITILVLSVHNDWTSNPLAFDEDLEWTEWYYMKPWTRCPPYIIGIGLGFLLHHTKRRRVRLHPSLVVGLWCLAVGTGLAVVYGQDTFEYLITQTKPSTFSNAVYNAFARSAWGAAVGWVVFACFHGYGGFVNDFLSYEAFGPLGKLAFNVYLIHYPLLPLIYAQVTYPLVVTHITIVLIILATFTISTVVSFAFAVVFELPIIACDRIILGWAAQKMGSLFGRGENKSKGKERTPK